MTDDSSPASCMQLPLARAVGLGKSLPPLHCEQGGAVLLNTQYPTHNARAQVAQARFCSLPSAPLCAKD